MDAGVDKVRAAYRAADRLRPALLGRGTRRRFTTGL